MLTNLKALVVVLGLAVIVFTLLKPLCLRYMVAEDFARRRNVWYVLTVTAFLSPNFWLYAVVAMPLLFWAGRKDSNPAGLYMLTMHVIPPLAFYIPVVGINQLFDLNQYRILSLAVLLPVAWRLRQSARDGTREGRFTLGDGLLLAYFVLQLVLFVPYESITHTMRRAFLFGIDALLLYYVLSRDCTERWKVADTIAGFTLAAAIATPIALFEAMRGWLLYQGLGFAWGDPISWAYLMRGEMLRAQVSAGHSIALGFLLASAFCFWLYLRRAAGSAAVSLIGIGWLWGGLVAAYARAPWLAALVMFFVYAGLGPDAMSRVTRATLSFAVLSALVLASPIGERVIDSLPFIGTLDAGNIEYRQELATVSWQLIQQNPYFGNPFVMQEMEGLRQGQGIIDLVNSYASVALFYGLVGLTLLLGFFVCGLWAAFRAVKLTARTDADASFLGAALVACMIGILAIMATSSFRGGLAQMFWAMGGLSIGYATAVRREMAWVASVESSAVLQSPAVAAGGELYRR